MAAGLIHLDTNVLIFSAATGHPVREKLQRWRAERQQFAVCSMAWAEFRCGPVTPELVDSWERVLSGNIVPVDHAIADRAAALFNSSGRRSRSLPDCLIAATAILSSARLATLNRQDFEPLIPHGLLLIET